MLLKKRTGVQNKVIKIRLSEYVPINESTCIDSVYQDNLYAIKFHGKPVSKYPLKNSKIEKTKEKNKINEILFSKKGPVNNVAKPKNKDKKRGINIIAKGIKTLNISSNVKEIAIQ